MRNVENPFFGALQLSNIYYHYTPLSVYYLGVVNSAQLHHGDNEPTDYMHFDPYGKRVTGKESNNFASHIMKTLDELSLLHNADCAGELDISFCNCSEQKR